jgi:uncharacterized protein YhbP (UPF0306 family)
VAATPATDLQDRVSRYLRAHHTMTIATVGPASAGSPPAAPARADRPPDGTPPPATPPSGNETAAPMAPHAASVFYAVDDAMRLVFLSKPTSAHGLHIGDAAPAAVTVTEQYPDWEAIQGVQLWGEVRRLKGAAKAAAMAAYLRRFPFVRELMNRPGVAESVRSVMVYRFEAVRAAFTDNTTGVFGREILDLKGR